MMNIWIRWSFGFWAYIDMKELRLRNIFFYNENKDVVECNLTDSVQFDMRVHCGFRMARSCCKLNYSKGDVFAVRYRGGEYDLYIPMCEVGFMKLDKKKYLACDGMTMIIKQRYCFAASGINFWNPNCDTHCFYPSKDKKHLNFELHIATEDTEKGKLVEEIVEAIRKECGVFINSYNMNKILEKFNITKI